MNFVNKTIPSPSKEAPLGASCQTPKPLPRSQNGFLAGPTSQFLDTCAKNKSESYERVLSDPIIIDDAVGGAAVVSADVHTGLESLRRERQARGQLKKKHKKRSTSVEREKKRRQRANQTRQDRALAATDCQKITSFFAPPAMDDSEQLDDRDVSRAGPEMASTPFEVKGGDKAKAYTDTSVTTHHNLGKSSKVFAGTEERKIHCLVALKQSV